MTRANRWCDKLVRLRTIGSATVICSDKTGTLTQNKMQVERLAWDGQTISRGEGECRSRRGSSPRMARPRGRSPEPSTTRERCRCTRSLLNAAINSTAKSRRKRRRVHDHREFDEGSLLQWLREGGVDTPRFAVSGPLI